MLRELFKNKKNVYNIAIAIFLGIILIVLSENISPENNTKNNKKNIPQMQKEETTYEKRLEKELEKTLENVKGVGQVDVMLTFENGKEIVTKDDSIREKATTNEEALNGDKRQVVTHKSQSSTVKIKEDAPLIIKEITPKVLGAIVVAQGGSNVEVKSMIIDATKSVLDIDINKIQVLQMK